MIVLADLQTFAFCAPFRSIMLGKTCHMPKNVPDSNPCRSGLAGIQCDSPPQCASFYDFQSCQEEKNASLAKVRNCSCFLRIGNSN